MKIDKPDAVIQLERTDDGIRLRTTHRRTAAYPLETLLSVSGIDGSEPISYRHANGAWPAGTKAKAAELDELDVPVHASNRAARAALQQAGRAVGSSDVLSKALRYRKTQRAIDPPTNRGVEHQQNTPQPEIRNTNRNTPPKRSSTRAEHETEQSGTLDQVDRNTGGCVPTEHPLVPTPKFADDDWNPFN